MLQSRPADPGLIGHSRAGVLPKRRSTRWPFPNHPVRPIPGPHRQDRVAPEPERVRGAELGGDVRGLPGARAEEPGRHPLGLPARLRHGAVVRPGRVHRQQEAAHPLQLLQGRAARGARRHLRPRHPAHAARERAAERGPAVRDRAARDPAARAGRQLEVDDRAPHQARDGGVLADARGGALHVRVGAAGEAGARHRRADHVQVPHARGAAAAHPAE